jgi:hypothetical protein
MPEFKPSRLFDLQEGDRFYLCNDRGRHVWQVVQITTTMIERYHAAPSQSLCYHLEDDNHQIKQVKRNQEVMLIRHMPAK